MSASVTPFKIGNVELGGGELFLIAGPCVVESEAHAMKMAEAIGQVTRRLGVPYIFKASYDKANRTSAASHRGPGAEEGLRVLGKIGEEFGLPVLTDVHETTQVRAAAEQPPDKATDRKCDYRAYNDGRIHDRDSPGTLGEL